ncbi:high-affinity nicotinic acid transporter [Coprinopsis cinerea AmutBmut pab1-1]|nr:high-affinity nicotinic acid transporter [Coprinopsis cinerea AmutBmut pab1-1]
MLTEDERNLAIARLKEDRKVQGDKLKERTTLRLVLHSFNVHTVVCIILFIILNVSFQGLSIFLPTIVNGLGTYSTVEVQLRTVPPYLISALWAIASGVASFRFRNRFAAVFASLLLLVIGYSIAIGTTDTRARYGACFLMVAGGGAGGPMVMTWGTENASPDTMRAVASAAIPGFGALGAIVSVWTYVPSDAPKYLNGNAANLGCACLACVLSIFLVLYLRWENRRRDAGKKDHVVEGKSQEELENMGYKHPEFRYQL